MFSVSLFKGGADVVSLLSGEATGASESIIELPEDFVVSIVSVIEFTMKRIASAVVSLVKKLPFEFVVKIA